MGFTIFHKLYSHQESITTGSYFQSVCRETGSKSFSPPSLFLLHSFSLVEIYDRFDSVFQTDKLTAKTLHVFFLFGFFFLLILSLIWAKFAQETRAGNSPL